MPDKNLGAAHWKRVAGLIEPGLGEAFRSHLICPDDDAPLDAEDQDVHGLLCPACGRQYRMSDGILSILPATDRFRASEEDLTRLKQTASDNQFLDKPEHRFGELWTKVERLAGDCAGKRVLDLCCGTGWAACWFAERGASVAAADIIADKGGLASAAEERQRRDLQFDLFQADICRLPFVEETFDIVFLADALHEVNRPEVLLGEAARVLSPDGIVVNIGEPIGRATTGMGLGATDPRREGKTLNPSDYQAIYREAGLTLEQITPDDLGGEEKRGLFSKVVRHFRVQTSTQQRLFVGRRDRPLSLSDLTILKRNV